MLELVKAFILGAVQGITEFLPVSSTGHLILFEKLLNISQDTYGLTFDAALHIGTLIAILWYFRKDWQEIIVSGRVFLRKIFQKPSLLIAAISHPQKRTAEETLILLLIIGTIPAVILGVLLEDVVDSSFRSPVLVAWMLILFSFLLIYIERTAVRVKQATQLSLFDGLIVGTAQAIALIPGVSRSGITIAAGMWRGMKRENAALFAFLLSAPIIAGAGGKKLLHVVTLLHSGSLTVYQGLFFVTGMISAALFGYLTIKYFLRFLAKHSLYPFIIYRIVLGSIILLVA